MRYQLILSRRHASHLAVLVLERDWTAYALSVLPGRSVRSPSNCSPLCSKCSCSSSSSELCTAACGLTQQIVHDFGPGDDGIRQAVVAALVREGQLRVVEAEGVQQRRVQVGDADDVLDGRVAEVVGRAVDVALLEAAAGEPQREGVAVVVAAVGALARSAAGRTRRSTARSSSRAGRGASGRAPGPALGWSVIAQRSFRLSAFLLCVSHGWPLRKICTKRTPRSTSRRASRQRVPYSADFGLSRP